MGLIPLMTIEVNLAAILGFVSISILGALGFFVKAWIKRTEKEVANVEQVTRDKVKELKEELGSCKQHHLERDAERVEAINRHDIKLTEITGELKAINTALENIKLGFEKLERKLEDIDKSTSDGLKVVLENIQALTPHNKEK